MQRFPLRTLRLRPGEELRVPVSLGVEPFAFGGQRYVVSPPELATTLVVQRTTSGTVFGLSLSAEVVGPCMRCLEPAAARAVVEAREYADDAPRGDEELVSEYVVDDHLEVAAWARDAIALALPDQILCRPDCAGLCPQCGRNLNVDPHTHEVEDVDPRWAALRVLKDE